MSFIKHGHGQVIGPDDHNEQQELEKIAGRNLGWTPQDDTELARENERVDGRELSD